jgi:accessory colonization factor AcfC
MIIFTNEISSLINKEGLANVEAKDVADALIKQYEWLDSEKDEEDILQEIDGDVIIWGKFKVDF